MLDSHCLSGEADSRTSLAPHGQKENPRRKRPLLCSAGLDGTRPVAEAVPKSSLKTVHLKNLGSQRDSLSITLLRVNTPPQQQEQN